MEPLPCVNRPIVHHLGLSRHRLWRAAKAQARRPRPRPARPSSSLALLLAAGLPLAWTERKYTCVQLRASISGYVHRALHLPRYTVSPPPRGLDVCCPPLRLTLRRCFRAALATRRTHEAHRPAPEHGRALLGRGLHASKHRNRRAVGGRATRPSAPAKHAAEPREPWPTARAAAPQGWAWLA